MTADAFVDLRRIVREELRGLALAELAVVQEVHPHASAADDDNFACTVRLRDSEIVLVRVPVLVSRKGMAAIPDVGDLVLVQFLGGDANAPIITGTLYNDEDRPPLNDEGEAVLQLPLGGGGVEARIKPASVTLDIGSALKLSLTDDDPVVSLDVGGGRGTLTIASDGTVTIESQTALAFKGLEVSIESETSMEIKAAAEMTIKGAIVKLN